MNRLDWRIFFCVERRMDETMSVIPTKMARIIMQMKMTIIALMHALLVGLSGIASGGGNGSYCEGGGFIGGPEEE